MGFADTASGSTTTGNQNNGDIISGQGLTLFELDHIFCQVAGTSPDAFMSMGIDDTGGFDKSLIHDNTILVPNQSQSANGSDAFQITGTGFSLFSNVISGYIISNWSGGNSQHQDGLQALQGSYIKVYNNIFEDLNNTSVFMDGYWGPFLHVWVYNNICQQTSSAANNGPGGIELGPDGQPPAFIYFTDCIVANNDMIDQYPFNGTSIAFGNCPPCNNSQPSPYTNCFMVNNVDVNSGGMTTYSSPISTYGNVTMSTATAQTNFLSYHTLVATNNYNLRTTATSVIGKGTNFSSYFTADFNGGTRAATGPWDIGAYVYGTNQPASGVNGFRIFVQ